MPATSPLSPAEALFLLKPNLTNGLRTIRVTLLWLLAMRILHIEEQGEEGLFRTKKVPYVRITRNGTLTLPPHVAAVIDLVRAAQADGGKMRDVVKQAEKEFKVGCFLYNNKFIVPALVERGLIEMRRRWISFTYHATAAGEEQRQRIRADIDKTREIPKLLKSDPAQAAAHALRLGITFLLVDDLKKHYKQLATAMRACDSDAIVVAGIDGGSIDTGQSSTSFDTEGFDLSCFDAGAFGALDACAVSFDAGFSDGASHGGDGGGYP
jgi:hypothetical protein